MMRKIVLIFAIIIAFGSYVNSQTTLSWRFANYEVVNAGTQLQFDVEVMADAAGTFHRDLQVYFDYNTAGFGSSVASGISITPLSLMDSHYTIVNNAADNTSSKIAIITEATNEMTQGGSATYFNEMPTTFTGLFSITMNIVSNSEMAGINFDEALMNGGQYYQDNPAGPLKYVDPCLYVNDLLTEKLSTVYGNITYANGASSPISDITVTLMDGAVPVTSDLSDSFGDYSLSSIDDGSYTLENTTTKVWGGLTMGDVLLSRQHFLGTTIITGIHFLAADVTWDTPHLVDMSDVLLMRQKFLDNSVAFGAPDYIFEPQSVNVINGLGTKSYEGICSGDPDASYTPPSK